MLLTQSSNPKFGDYADHIYPIDLEINDTTDTAVIIIILIQPIGLKLSMYHHLIKIKLFLDIMGKLQPGINQQ
jgi:hypothetical protein